MKPKFFIAVTIGILVLFFIGCGGSSSSDSSSDTETSEEAPVIDAATDTVEDPAFDASSLSKDVDNPYFALTPGTSFVYESSSSERQDEEGSERVEIFVSHETREVAGVECTVVVDRVYEDGELIEETFDWYAQDAGGNVWYMGEDSAEYEDGEFVSTEGSWEAGVDGAEAGIIMKADFTVGDNYQQEYYEGEAEDMAEIAELDVAVTLSDGTEYTCVKIKEWNPLEPDVVEYKYFAENVGLVLEEKEDGSESFELLETAVDTEPDIDPEYFVAIIDNPYFPLTPGTTYTYEGETEDGTETVEVYVTGDTKEVMGVTCIVVRDRDYLDEELIEETYDWYAQDSDGNVWYFGEDSAEYEDGEVVSTEGSWEAGVDGAEPGIIMEADPRVGDTYRQEYYEDEAEDMGAVVALDESVSVPYGNFDDCLQTLDWNPLEEDSEEYKYYAEGIGLVLETDEEGEEALELVSITTE
jgi:hypothetical protein